MLVLKYRLLSCQGAWLHPLFSSAEVPSALNCQKICIWVCDWVQKYCVLDLSIHYGPPVLECTLHVVILCCTFGPRLLCADVESNPGPTNGNDVNIDVHSKFCECSYVINCGFALVAIYDLSSTSRGHHCR